ncbi:hypothetical protein P170DRAFT_49969 [Aspergillus steynii IBT 23096]|uniref:Uncharacterized protein n=1 Tax=Aspergillus steynii IBT 23096 TaxID=1392250 RepID=A0A2I2GSC5_9EURO|nr:uncharacterized protein P170DRAFT_49969 [Aspergillus steynii IBT 23096]PLB55782.1 hypothetical protein P170DRAFT_49969 [Aspergillus steynii IBT 23096]
MGFKIPPARRELLTNGRTDSANFMSIIQRHLRRFEIVGLNRSPQGGHRIVRTSRGGPYKWQMLTRDGSNDYREPLSRRESSFPFHLYEVTNDVPMNLFRTNKGRAQEATRCPFLRGTCHKYVEDRLRRPDVGNTISSRRERFEGEPDDSKGEDWRREFAAVDPIIRSVTSERERPETRGSPSGGRLSVGGASIPFHSHPPWKAVECSWISFHAIDSPVRSDRKPNRWQERQCSGSQRI